MKLKKRYLVAPLTALLLTSPINYAKNNPAKANYLENIVKNFSSLIRNKPTEIPEVTIYGKKQTIEEDLLKRKIQEQSSDEIKTPHYRLTADECSKYARLATRKLFNKKYNSDHAWELRYKNKIVQLISENTKIED